MPFRSKAQQRFMFAAEARGELPKGTAREWAHETDDIKKLPERIHKKKRKEGKKEALAKFGLDEHDVYSGPPSFCPVDTAETVSSEAGKQLDERRDDGRTDLKNAPMGFAILGNKVAAIKEADALSRAVARGAVTPSRQTAKTLLGGMAENPTKALPSATAVHRTLQRMQDPATPGMGSKQVNRLRKMRAGFTALEQSPEQLQRAQAIEEKSLVPRINAANAQAVTAGGSHYAPALKGGAPKELTPTQGMYAALQQHLGKTPESVRAALAKRQINTRRPGQININPAQASLAPGVVEHEVGERWMAQQAGKGRVLTPLGSHFGPEALVREWGRSATTVPNWDKAHALRAERGSPAEKEVQRLYRQVGGTQGAPVPADSRQSRAIQARLDDYYKRLAQTGSLESLSKKHLPDLMSILSADMIGQPLSEGASALVRHPDLQKAIWRPKQKSLRATAKPLFQVPPEQHAVDMADWLHKKSEMTPAFIRSIARDADVEVGQPEFKEKVRGLTGKVKLEEMTTSELQQVAKMIWQKEAAEKKKKKKQTGVDKLVDMTSGRGAAGAAAPVVANTLSYLAAIEEPRSGKHDFSQPEGFRKLTKRMGTGDVPKFYSPDAGMGHAKVTIKETAQAPKADAGKPAKPSKPRTEKRWVVGLPSGTSEATAAHELGHVRNWQAVEEALGGKGARKLMGHLGKLHDATMFTAPVASAYSAIDDDLSWAPGLAQLAVSSPRLLDEALASGRAMHHLIGRHGALAGLREGASLLPAFGTYATMAATPLAITGARRLWRRYHPDEE